MAEVADHLPPPDPEVVASIALALAGLPADKINRMLEKTLGQLYHGVRFRGWSHATAVWYTTRFGNGVLETIRASASAPSGARMQ